MPHLLIIQAIVLIVFTILFVWHMYDFYGLPAGLKCKLGAHDKNVHKTYLGWGIMGVPVTTYDWVCKNCGKRGF